MLVIIIVSPNLIVLSGVNRVCWTQNKVAMMFAMHGELTMVVVVLAMVLLVVVMMVMLVV